VAYGDRRFALGALSPTSLRVSISAVTETSSWAMMIAGFGAVAWALRRTRVRARGVAFTFSRARGRLRSSPALLSPKAGDSAPQDSDVACIRLQTFNPLACAELGCADPYAIG
jgi:hypothetical protein